MLHHSKCCLKYSLRGFFLSVCQSSEKRKKLMLAQMTMPLSKGDTNSIWKIWYEGQWQCRCFVWRSLMCVCVLVQQPTDSTTSARELLSLKVLFMETFASRWQSIGSLFTFQQLALSLATCTVFWSAAHGLQCGFQKLSPVQYLSRSGKTKKESICYAFHWRRQAIWGPRQDNKCQ